MRHFTIDDVPNWYQYKDRPMFLGELLNEANSDHMTVGFGRYKKGESNEWVVTYDEVNIVTKGSFTFRTAEKMVTAKVGEVLFITKGTRVIYEAHEDMEIVFVTYPHFTASQQNSEHADLLEAWHQVK